MRALCASGDIADSLSVGFTRVTVPGTAPGTLGTEMEFENLPGAPFYLIAMAKLTAFGVRLHLDDNDPSYAIMPSGLSAAVLNREHPNSPGIGGSGLWYLDFVSEKRSTR
jgi:hypothetical protein